MTSIYVLSCENNKYYVGKTGKMLYRIKEHFANNGCEWTKLYKPIRVLEVKDDADEFDEDRYTKIYMKKHGIDNVRGGSYSQIKLPLYKLQALQDEICTTRDLCFKCNERGHFAKDCEIEQIMFWYCKNCNMEFDNEYKAEQHASKCQSKSNVNNCYRCGRKGHFVNSCYATTHLKGYKL